MFKKYFLYAGVNFACWLILGPIFHQVLYSERPIPWDMILISGSVNALLYPLFILKMLSKEKGKDE